MINKQMKLIKSIINTIIKTKCDITNINILEEKIYILL